MVERKSLGSGNLTTSLRVLYAVPRGKITEITWFNLCNEGPVTASFHIFVRRAQKSRVQIATGRLGQLYTARLVGERETLALTAGDAIEGRATTGAITYLITGAES